jgi:hypothetical protein
MPPAVIRDKGAPPPAKRQAGKFLKVNFAAVLHPNHDNYQPIVVKLAYQAQVADPEAAEPCKTAEKRLGEAPWIGMYRQPIIR